MLLKETLRMVGAGLSRDPTKRLAVAAFSHGAKVKVFVSSLVVCVCECGGGKAARGQVFFPRSLKVKVIVQQFGS